MIHKHQNFISPNLCERLIILHNEYYPTLGLPAISNSGLNYLDLFTCCNALQDETSSNSSDPLKYMISHINNFTRSFSPSTYINYCQLVAYPTGSKYTAHVDRDFSSWTSILYLNDNFVGGETVVDGEVIKPEAGKIISFNGNVLEHEVLEVQTGTRYILATWHKDFNDSKN